MRVAVIGLGYVGAVTAAWLASRGHEVWGVDVDRAKVDAIRVGHSPVSEPGLEALRAARPPASGHHSVVIRNAAPRHLLDLIGRLGTEIESLPGYEGIGW